MKKLVRCPSGRAWTCAWTSWPAPSAPTAPRSPWTPRTCCSCCTPPGPRGGPRAWPTPPRATSPTPPSPRRTPSSSRRGTCSPAWRTWGGSRATATSSTGRWSTGPPRSCSRARPCTRTTAATGTWCSATRSPSSTRRPQPSVRSCGSAPRRSRSTIGPACGCWARWGSRSTRRRGAGTTGWWARAAAPSWTPSGRRRLVGMWVHQFQEFQRLRLAAAASHPMGLSLQFLTPSPGGSWRATGWRACCASAGPGPASRARCTATTLGTSPCTCRPTRGTTSPGTAPAATRRGTTGSRGAWTTC
mmetsp:Transcript_2122/g.3530  ORF Transcript_2122/g.3530 Transcript_2122/m.3530 type:complete len:302 (+) Transcript_2122:689-1594(+)